MKRYKFQALVRPAGDGEGEARATLTSGSHRVVLRAQHSETKRSRVFGALGDADEEGPTESGGIGREG